MRNIARARLALLALSIGGVLTALPASAHTYVYADPYFAPQPVMYDNYGYAPAPYYVRERPFSLHRFVGNVGGAAVGVPLDVMFGHHDHDRYYYGY